MQNLCTSNANFSVLWVAKFTVSYFFFQWWDGTASELTKANVSVKNQLILCCLYISVIRSTGCIASLAGVLVMQSEVLPCETTSSYYIKVALEVGTLSSFTEETIMVSSYMTHIVFQCCHLEAFLQVPRCWRIHTAKTALSSYHYSLMSWLPLLLHCDIATVCLTTLNITKMVHVALLDLQRLVEKIHCKREHIINLWIGGRETLTSEIHLPPGWWRGTRISCETPNLLVCAEAEVMLVCFYAVLPGHVLPTAMFRHVSHQCMGCWSLQRNR